MLLTLFRQMEVSSESTLLFQKLPQPLKMRNAQDGSSIKTGILKKLNKNKKIKTVHTFVSSRNVHLRRTRINLHYSLYPRNNRTKVPSVGRFAWNSSFTIIRIVHTVVARHLESFTCAELLWVWLWGEHGNMLHSRVTWGSHLSNEAKRRFR